MKYTIYSALLFFYINLFGYVVQYDGGMCFEYANFQVNESSFTGNLVNRYDGMGTEYNNFKFSGTDVKYVVQEAANYWNEAGSEHHLYYDGTGDSNPEIYLTWEDSSAWMTRRWWMLGYDDYEVCQMTSAQTIRVNLKYWQNTSSTNGINFFTELVHEIGHLLSLDHTQSSDANNYPFISMIAGSAGRYRHLTEDDKYGMRTIYGEDDVSMRTNTGTWSGNLSSAVNISSYHLYQSGSTYTTFVKPNIVFQPNSTKGYDYIITWVRSSNNKVYYAFAKDDGNDLITYGSAHELNSVSLSTPSIAINGDGSKAVIVWKEEDANYTDANADLVYYTEINTSTGSNSGVNLLSGTTAGTNLDKIYSKSTPTVMWQQIGTTNTNGRFIILWTERPSYYLWTTGNGYIDTTDTNNWRLKYIISNNNSASFTPTNQKYLSTFKSSWNPISGHCQLENNGCVLFLNEFYNSDANIDNSKITHISFKINSSNYYLLDYLSSHRYNYHRNYGHLTVIPKTGSYSSLLTTIPKAAQSQITAFGLEIDKIIGENDYAVYISDPKLSITGSSDDTGARLGHSGCFNTRTQKFRFIWIPE